MSMIKNIIKRVLQERYDEEHDEYYPHPNDHSGDGEIEWTVTLPMTDELRDELLKSGVCDAEDMQDLEGNWEPFSQFDVIIEYEIDGYPDDEEIGINKVYISQYDFKNHKAKPVFDVTRFLTKEYINELEKELTESGHIELHSYDYEGQVRSDYYDSVL